MAYIRKEDLINKIKPEQEDDYEHFVSIANVRKILRNFVESVAEVDAVEVVRCEDCVRCGFCGDATNLEVMGFYGYCSRGKRREDG